MKRNSILWVLLLVASWSNAQLITSDLPIVIINTNGGAIEDDPKIEADFGIISNNSGGNSSDDPWNSYSGKIGIEIRGNSTQGFDKKSYAVQLWDVNGAETSESLLGMGADEDWVLHAMHIDKSLLRIPMTFHLAEQMGNYASRWRYVELIINGEYRGLYTLVEKIKQGPQRVNIDTLGSNDESGGFILRIDWDENEGGFNSQYKSMAGTDMKFIYYYPTGKLKANEKAHLKNSMNLFEEAVFSPDFTNSKGEGLSDVADLKSFVDFILVNEMSKNSDGYKLSSYLHKDSDLKDKRWKAGPIWDFDQTYGVSSVCSGDNYSGWTFLENYDGCEDLNSMPLWYENLVKDAGFCNLLNNRWIAFRSSFLHQDSVNQWIDDYELLIREARQRNFQKWDVIGDAIWIEPDGFPTTYEGEIKQLKDWMKNRFEWMDRNLRGLCEFSSEKNWVKIYPNPSFGEVTINIVPGTSISITDMSGKLIWDAGLIKESKYVFNTSQLAAGCYVVYSKSSRGTYSGKFVVGMN